MDISENKHGARTGIIKGNGARREGYSKEAGHCGTVVHSVEPKKSPVHAQSVEHVNRNLAEFNDAPQAICFVSGPPHAANLEICFTAILNVFILDNET